MPYPTPRRTVNSNNWTAGAKGWVTTASQGQQAARRNSTGTATLKFTNLSGQPYLVEVVGSGRAGFAAVGDYTVNGGFADSDFGGTGANGDDYNVHTDGLNNWLIWDAVSNSGQIDVDMTWISGNNGTWLNAVRLTELPEPGVGAMLAVAIGFVGWRPRRH